MTCLRAVSRGNASASGRKGPGRGRCWHLLSSGRSEWSSSQRPSLSLSGTHPVVAMAHCEWTVSIHVLKNHQQRRRLSKNKREMMFTALLSVGTLQHLCSHFCNEPHTQEGVIIIPISQRWKLSHCLDILPKPYNL